MSVVVSGQGFGQTTPSRAFGTAPNVLDLSVVQDLKRQSSPDGQSNRIRVKRPAPIGHPYDDALEVVSLKLWHSFIPTRRKKTA